MFMKVEGACPDWKGCNLVAEFLDGFLTRDKPRVLPGKVSNKRQGRWVLQGDLHRVLVQSLYPLYIVKLGLNL